MEITFLISEFTGADGSPAFRPPLQLEPPRFTLRSGEERKVTLRLPLLPDLFLPGVRYNGVVVVRGYEDLVLALTAWADPPVSAEQPAETLVRPHSNGDSIPVHKRNRATRQTQKPQGVEE